MFHYGQSRCFDLAGGSNTPTATGAMCIAKDEETIAFLRDLQFSAKKEFKCGCRVTTAVAVIGNAKGPVNATG